MNYPTPTNNPPAPPASQSTAIETARAIAEVQAAVTVAQSVPRIMGRVVAEMQDACGRLSLAERAFYTVKNRGSGPTVHLARELARVFGNIDYGVHELRRDDVNGESEIRAYCWDQETNTRQTRTFIAPHETDTKQGRQKIRDLIDVYRNNQSVGARALRECIMTVLPAWFVADAEEACRKTIRDGGGIPLATRIDKMLGRFRDLDVSVGRLEKRIGKPRAGWGPGDLAEMTIVYHSITRGEVTVADEFPNSVTAAEITGAHSAGAQPPASQPPAVAPAGKPAGELEGDGDPYAGVPDGPMFPQGGES